MKLSLAEQVFRFAGYWNSEQNFFGETGWLESEARDSLWHSRHPLHDITHWQHFPEPPK